MANTTMMAWNSASAAAALAGGSAPAARRAAASRRAGLSHGSTRSNSLLCTRSTATSSNGIHGSRRRPYPMLTTSSCSSVALSSCSSASSSSASSLTSWRTNTVTRQHFLQNQHRRQRRYHQQQQQQQQESSSLAAASALLWSTTSTAPPAVLVDGTHCAASAAAAAAGDASSANNSSSWTEVLLGSLFAFAASASLVAVFPSHHHQQQYYHRFASTTQDLFWNQDAGFLSGSGGSGGSSGGGNYSRGGGSGSGGSGSGGGPSLRRGNGATSLSDFAHRAFDKSKSQQQQQQESHSESFLSNDGTQRAYDISVRALRGARVTMEDEYFVADGGRFAAVFDGHGGGGVSQFLRNRLYPLTQYYLKVKQWEYDDEIAGRCGGAGATSSSSTAVAVRDWKKDLSQLNHSTPTQASNEQQQQQALAAATTATTTTTASTPSLSSCVAALRSAFDRVERDVLLDDSLRYQGSTAVVVVLHENDDGHRTVLSANVGDSRAILSRGGVAVELTRDHKPSEEREKARILGMGETIEWDSFSKVHRVRNLSLSRAIGDRYAKPAVSGQVEIMHYPVMEDRDEFVLLASDGLWDVMSSQDAVSFVHDRLEQEILNHPAAQQSDEPLSPEDLEACKLVIRRNMARFVAREAIRRGSGDNVCVLIVWLDKKRDDNKAAPPTKE